MTADTLLLVCPPDDPLGLLADSVGGGKVPVARHNQAQEYWTRTEPVTPCRERGLVLRLRGQWDDIGMGRFRRAVDWDNVSCAWSISEIEHAIADHLPGYRLATLAADGREKEF